MLLSYNILSLGDTDISVIDDRFVDLTEVHDDTDQTRRIQ